MSFVFSSFCLAAENRTGFATVRPQGGEFPEIFLEDGMRPDAILKALEIALQFHIWLCRQGIDHPVLLALGLDQSSLF